MSRDKLTSYMNASVETLAGAKVEVQAALRLIREYAEARADPLPLQLLAVRRYLRMGGRAVQASWAWTPEESDRQRRGGAVSGLYDQAGKVQTNFAADNPGFTLIVSPLRSLERQVVGWNRNNTVQQAGTTLLQNMLRVLEGAAYPVAPAGESTTRFTSCLRASRVVPEPSSAAPGTSDHGQARAVDFVVTNGRRVVAGTETAHIIPFWKREGWEAKLIHATRGTLLVGPLQKPYEPWHWRLAT
ncbi:MAG: hypothetical protein JWN04_532 [Myxococcaceae bacterium]|nr:hypothetical protein [Myxococcaceae bacterium]